MLELPERHPERTAALARLIFAPPVFADLRSKYGDQLPLSVRHALVTQEFAPNAAEDIIRLYRENLVFVRDQGAVQDYSLGQTESGPAETPTLEPRGSSMNRGHTFPEQSSERVLQFQIAEDTDARIHFRGRPNRPAIKKLIALLELSADTFPA